ncbi:MAG: zf-TFIIB domain-containing protein [Candidatus Wildermuthbacteria bacterium]|nr:zf-TFIIB domain-containing protein [Candidatus Wildermuthbacteria bacterium]
MKMCPHHNAVLEKAVIMGIELDFCPKDYGFWLDEHELEQAKDARDRDLRWLDIDLWKDVSRFRLNKKAKLCPRDRLPMYEVEYGDSGINVDLCSLCHGVWLDRGEFKNIVVYLRERAEHRVLYHYARDLFEEAWEVFSGPEMLREEILDFVAVLKLFAYKFAAQYAKLSQIMVSLPR